MTLVILGLAGFGLVMGSFFSVVIKRLGREGGIIAGRSHCRHCGRILQWWELIPLAGFFILNGKCSGCHKPLGLFYPLLEIGTAALFIFYWIRNSFTLTPETLFYFVLLCIFALLFLFDLLYFQLPNVLTFSGILASVIYILIFQRPDFLPHALSSLILGGFFAILYVISQGHWIGFGDSKLALLIGMGFGYPWGLLTIIAAVWLGTLYGLVLMALHRGNLKTALPFGSFIAAAAIGYILFRHDLQFLAQFF